MKIGYGPYSVNLDMMVRTGILFLVQRFEVGYNRVSFKNLKTKVMDDMSVDLWVIGDCKLCKVSRRCRSYIFKSFLKMESYVIVKHRNIRVHILLSS